MKALARCVVAVGLTVSGLCASVFAGVQPAEWQLNTLTVGMSKDAVKKLGFTRAGTDAQLYVGRKVTFGGKTWTPYAQLDNGTVCSWSLTTDTDQYAAYSQAALDQLARFDMVVFALAGSDSLYSLLDRAVSGADAAKIQREVARFTKKHFVNGQPSAMYLMSQQTFAASFGKRGQEAFVAFAPKELIYAVQTDEAGVQVTASTAVVAFDPDVE